MFNPHSICVLVTRLIALNCNSIVKFVARTITLKCYAQIKERIICMLSRSFVETVRSSSSDVYFSHVPNFSRAIVIDT